MENTITIKFNTLDDIQAFRNLLQEKQLPVELVNEELLESIEITRPFYETFGHKTGDINTLTDLKIRNLRTDLIQEESHELAVAMGVEERFLLNAFNKLFWNKKADDYKAEFLNHNLALDALKYKIQSKEYSTEFDLDETIDALADLRVVTDGTDMALGVHILAREALIETNESNMSKGCLTEDEALYNAAEYAKEGITLEYREMNGMFILYNKENNKILKNKLRFKAPNYGPIINKYKNEQQPEV